MKIYTRTGDDGTTGLLGNARVRKDDGRIEAYGSVDETNAALGTVLSLLPTAAEEARGWLSAIQNDLFVIGAWLATPMGGAPRVVLEASRAVFLEETIDGMEKELPALKNFILPQGAAATAQTHLARAICRRAERRVVTLAGYEPVAPEIVIYLNRLSDWLFVLARWINHREGGHETAWIPKQNGDQAPDQPQPDRLNATLQKLEADKEKRKTLFEKASSDLQKKKETAEKLFRSNVDQIKREGGKVEKPLRDMDLD